MSIDLEELKRLAEANYGWKGADSAWLHTSNDGSAIVGNIDGEHDPQIHNPVAVVDVAQYDGFEGDSMQLAQFYAAANPATVLGLIAEIERLRDDVSRLTGEADALERQLNEARNNDITAMGYLADCRIASGDNGKRMLPEFVEYLREMKRQRDELLTAISTVVDAWSSQFERNGHLAPSWCKQARTAIANAEKTK